jgi:hypothetical protein
MQGGETGAVGVSSVWTAHCHPHLLLYLVPNARTFATQEAKGVKRVQGFLHGSNLFSIVSSSHAGNHPNIYKDPVSPISPAREKWAKVSSL